uniref:G_PROTEIN_RECEP_F1_2 domain-containing protein n=1 Tax=Heterorhabditis bacteriophora TaxID=37862 RepID=A0A1I7WHR0_HETBA
MTGQDSNCNFLECKMTNKFDYNISPFEIYKFHDMNSITVSIATPLLYLHLSSKVSQNHTRTRDGQIQKVGTTISLTLNDCSFQVFFQVFLISLFNVLCAFIYVYMQYFPPSKWFALLGKLGWQLSAEYIERCSYVLLCIFLFPLGCSVVAVYMTMNRAIRRGVFSLFKHVEEARITLHSATA